MPGEVAAAVAPAADASVGAARFSPRTRAILRWVIRLLGLALLAAAAVTIMRSQTAVSEAWAALRTAPQWLLVVLFLLPLVNIAAVSESFRLMTTTSGRVGHIEMAALITSAWLFNQLPLRPGLVGRIAYHRLVNGIPVKDAVLVTLQVLACAALSLSCLVGTVLIAAKCSGSDAGIVLWMLAPLPVLGLITLILHRLSSRAASSHARNAWRFAACIALRYIDLAAWIARYSLIFLALGRPLPWRDATIVGAASEAAMLLPIQVGAREWVVGVVAARLASPGTLTSTDIAPGLLADVVTRAIEIAVALPLGVLAAFWLQRRLAALARSKPTGAPDV